METHAREPSGGSVVIYGLPGHPLHPPLTDATIGMFVLATGLAVIGALGALDAAAGKACWLALIGGLIVAVPTAATGFAEWVRLPWGSPAWRTATWHLTVMAGAVTLFALAAWLQHTGYENDDVTTGGLVLSVAGLLALTAGGWLGGKLVFVHGLRVLPDGVREPVEQAAPAPRPTTTGGERT